MTYEEYHEKYMEDVNAHKPAEKIVTQVLNNLNNGYHFEDVADNEKYFNKGDIKMIKDGKRTRCIDVKDDDKIANTGNFFVESDGWSKIYNCPKKGWISSKYDYVAVISQSEQIIWILSFKRLKEIYNKTDLTGGERKKAGEFWDNIKYGYTIPIEKAIELDCVLAKITYDYDAWFEEYIPLEYLNKNKLQTEAA